jgi:GDP-L-fucose synthase
MDIEASVYIADHHGLIGSALRDKLSQLGCAKIISDPPGACTLRDAKLVDRLFSRARPEFVFLIGGASGGIGANQKRPADLMLDNLLVNCHVIENARRYGTRKLLYLGSSCSYPKFVEQPMRVDSLMSGGLEPTNESYGIAKLAGLYLCRAYRQQFQAEFITAVPANVFGPGDDFSAEDSHVIAALMRRMHEAKSARQSEVVIWGSGLPRREFILAEDMADACIFLMDHYDEAEPVNVGAGADWCIRELAEMIAEVVGFAGNLVFDRSKPDGMPAKLLDSSVLQTMGWRPKTSLKEGLIRTYQWFTHEGTIRERNAGPIL